MREHRVLVLALALVLASALAGCFGKDKDDTGGATTGGGTNTTTGGGTTGGGTTGGGTTGGGGSNTTAPPPKPPPVSESFSIALSPQAKEGSHPFNVPAVGWVSFTVSVNAQGPNSQVPFLADKITVSVVDPAGTAQGSTDFAAGAPSAPKEISITAGGAGSWTVTATATTASVSATVSGTIDIAY